MATLEVHDAQGRVQFVELERDHPVLFGSSPHCEVILEGEGINPVHGRIRWKRGRFKIEASPDAEYVLINGHRMASGSIGVGDEVVVGPCRFFLLRVEESAEPAGRTSRAAAEEGRTVVAPPPVAGAGAGAGAGAARYGPPSNEKGSRSKYVRPGEMPAEKPGWARDLAEGRLSTQASGSSPVPEAAIGLRGRFRQVLRKWLPQDEAPGQERIISSPLVVSLVLMLGVLVGMGFWLRNVISATIAERTFNRAMQSFEDGDYRTAIRDFEAFARDYPDDARAPKARVIRALANVRQYVAPNGATWTSALEAAREMLDEYGRGGRELSEAFRDEKMELGELVLRIGEGLADRARGTAEPKALAEAESSVALHREIVGEAAAGLLAKSPLPGKLDRARAAVRKAKVRGEAIAAMDRALAESSALGVYDARDGLVEQYPDLAQDRELIARMTSASELIRKAVTVKETRRPGERGPRTEVLGPATGVILRVGDRLQPASKAAGPAGESIAFALAEGIGYGIDGATGAPLWQLDLGLASPFVPQPIPGEDAAIAFDARANELIRLDARNGVVAWRLGVGERVASPPLVLGNQLVQVLPSGKLLFLTLESGDLQATMDLGRPLARTPVGDESGRHLYVLGRQDILYILNRDPLGCAAVEYLGHPDGSIPCAPAMLGRYLIVPRNETLSDSLWQILLLDEDGAHVRPVQEVPVKGWTWQTPTASGPFLWAIGDRGAFEAFAVGEYGSKLPFRSVAKMTPDARATGPAFAMSRSERELWSASGHTGRYLLDPEHGTIQVTPLSGPGPARAPLQSAGKRIVATFEDRELRGTALLGLDPESAEVVWKTVVGTPWPTALAPAPTAGALATLGRDGREVIISPDRVADGGFVVLSMAPRGIFSLPAGLRLRFDREGGKSTSVVVPRPYTGSLWVQDPSKREGWREETLPSPVAAEPVAWQDGVLIPAKDARVYLIDPVSGRSKAEPFVPKFDRDRQGKWLGASVLDASSAIVADEVGRVYRLAVRTTPVPRLVAEAERTLDSRIIADPLAIGSAVLLATEDGQIRSLAARDLSPIGAWPMEAAIAGRPVSMGDGGLVLDRAGNIQAFGRDGRKTWSIGLGSEAVGAPMVRGSSLIALTGDGVLHVRSRADGAERDQRQLGILPAGGPIAAGDRTVIPIAPGTFRPLVPGTLPD